MFLYTSTVTLQRPKTGNQRGPAKVREIQTRQAEYQQMAMGKEFIPETRRHRDSANYSDGQTPSRPSSLELNQQFMAQQGYAGQNYTGQIPNQGYPGSGHPQGQYAHTNGPVPATGGGNVPNNYQGHHPPQMTEQQRYQYNHNHNVDMTMQEAGHYDARHGGSPVHSPSKQRMSSSKSNDKISSPRPSQPPPAPPGGMQRDSPLGGPGSASRENLPPPPPPPPNDAGGHPVARGPSQYGSPGQQLHMNHMNHHHHPGVRDSPIRTQSHSPSPQHHTKSSTPDSIDLPPPPPPPPIGQTPDTPGSMSSMPPPPPTPPPPDMYHAHQAGHAAPGAPAPPPPPPPPSGAGGGRVPNGNIPGGGGGHLAAHHQPDAASLASSASTKSDPEPKAPEPVKDERSDLLAAIRQGITFALLSLWE